MCGSKGAKKRVDWGRDAYDWDLKGEGKVREGVGKGWDCGERRGGCQKWATKVLAREERGGGGSFPFGQPVSQCQMHVCGK